jgi:hypothetical protein
MTTPTFVLVRPLRATHLSRNIGFTTASLPAGARVSMIGLSTNPGFVEVICANVRYDVREEDLRAHAFEPRPSRAEPADTSPAYFGLVSSMVSV